MRSEVAEAPACWVTLCLSAVGRCEAGKAEGCLELVYLRLSPGWLAGLRSGAVVIMEHPDSLRKASLLIFHALKRSGGGGAGSGGGSGGASSGSGDYETAVLDARGLLAKVTPPQPYNPWESAGTGKGDKNLSSAQKCQVLMRPSVRTVHPEGRALQAIWIVERPLSGEPTSAEFSRTAQQQQQQQQQQRHSQIVVVLHAVDGRVCVAQISGEGSTIPPTLPSYRCDRRRPIHWDVWARSCPLRRNALYGQRIEVRSKRRYNVPICREVLAVLPREDEIVVIHKHGVTLKTQRRLGCPVACWRVVVPKAASASDAATAPAEGAAGITVPTFYGYQLNYKGGGSLFRQPRGKGGGWLEDWWSATRAMPLPEDIVDDRWPVVLDVADFEVPSCDATSEPDVASCASALEVVKWGLADPQAVRCVRSWTRGAEWSHYGNKGNDGKGRPFEPRFTIGPKGPCPNQMNEACYAYGVTVPVTQHFLAAAA
eukprot:NODE_7520_length_1572_cov_3.581315.p1 GENE.NODE_7520_length_1572_cov_3.581315~~NODE_7520_length_1572_cov_3.581315.p1  ORF type:complete len:518 (+),score=121.69 NODE_7520_length_1572_cov_3.581315:104-1555(+)